MLKSILHYLKCIMYELLPVHPQYAYKQIIYFKKITTKNTKIIMYQSYILFNFMMKSIRCISIKTYVKVAAWILVWNLFVYIDFGSLFIIISLFGVIAMNLGEIHMYVY